MIDRKKRALWLNSVYRLTLKTNCKQLLWLDVRWIQEYRHCMLKIALIFISYFNNQCLASELTGSIIHERVDSINYGEQVTSSTVNLLVRWQIKKFNYKSHFIQPFTVQQTTSTRSKKQSYQFDLYFGFCEVSFIGLCSTQSDLLVIRNCSL